MQLRNNKLRLLFKLLRQNISIWQICGFVIANLLGGIIVLFGIQAYIDFDNFINKKNGLLNEGYVVISKPISGLTTLGSILGAQPTFSNDEIEQLEEHQAVTAVGRFTAATFELSGSFALADIKVSTDLFMESVPDRFIDVKFNSEEIWKADINCKELPVIIPRRYLSIYNYGYASSKGLPQLSEGLTSMFPIKIRVRGNNITKYYDAKIVGYTDRLNTILVPETFLQQANSIYGEKGESQPSRLILETKVSGKDTAFIEYLEKSGYAIEGDTENIQLQTLVHSILWVVIGIGGVVSLLAFFLLLISVQLLIEKNKEKFVNLNSLGYSIKEIATPYLLLIAGIDTAVWLAAIIAVTIVYPNILAFIVALAPDMSLAPLLPLWGIAIAFAAIFILLHRRVIIGQLRRICK